MVKRSIASLFHQHDRGELQKKLQDRGHVLLFSTKHARGAQPALSPYLMVLDLFQAVLVPRIESLPSVPWQTQVYACFIKNMSKKVDGYLNEHHFQAYHLTQELLQHYEDLVPLIILGLAAWKAACIIHGPILHGTPTSFLFWLSEGWKKTKQDHFQCNEMEIIVLSFVPFLYEKDHFGSFPQFESSKKRLFTHGSPAVVEDVKQKRSRLNIDSASDATDSSDSK